MRATVGSDPADVGDRDAESVHELQRSAAGAVAIEAFDVYLDCHAGAYAAIALVKSSIRGSAARGGSRTSAATA